MTEIVPVAEKAFLVGMEIAGQRRPLLSIDDSLEELALLADTAGMEVVGQSYQRLRTPHPETMIGPGKIEEIKGWVEELKAGVVIFDDELRPRAQRELDRRFGEQVRVLDRSALILDIFAQHARTREGALQVMLAQYEYRLPRLTRMWTHLARQAGGGAGRGGTGGVGLRGPGETQLETDRREIRRQIGHLKAQLEEVRAHRERHRAQRRRSKVPVLALVGYTNAGKSTLLNALTGAGVLAVDQLFATLDPTSRRVRLPQGTETVMTDTVGFIQKLPHSLIAAFRATLEEIEEASAILHVVDVSHPNALSQYRVVESTLRDELAVAQVPRLLVINKVDRDDEVVHENLARFGEFLIPHCPVSALTGQGLEGLLESVERLLADERVWVELALPMDQGALRARFYQIATHRSETMSPDALLVSGLIRSEDLVDFLPFMRNRG